MHIPAYMYTLSLRYNFRCVKMSLERVVHVGTVMTLSGIQCQMRVIKPTMRISIRV